MSVSNRESIREYKTDPIRVVRIRLEEKIISYQSD